MVFSSRIPLFLFLSSLFMNAALAEIVCEELPAEVCAFSISSGGKRCLLETWEMGLQCRTSEVVMERMAGYIESEKCVEACGVDRKSIGISSDALLEPLFAANLCSPPCYRSCPNIVDLFFNLAAGEGVSLPELCKNQRSSPRRAMAELLSSGAAAGPICDPSAFFSASAPVSL